MHPNILQKGFRTVHGPAFSKAPRDLTPKGTRFLENAVLHLSQFSQGKIHSLELVGKATNCLSELCKEIISNEYLELS